MPWLVVGVDPRGQLASQHQQRVPLGAAQRGLQRLVAGPALAGRVVNDRRQLGRLPGLLPGASSGFHAEDSTPGAAQSNCSPRLCCESTIFVSFFSFSPVFSRGIKQSWAPRAAV